MINEMMNILSLIFEWLIPSAITSRNVSNET